MLNNILAKIQLNTSSTFLRTKFKLNSNKFDTILRIIFFSLFCLQFLNLSNNLFVNNQVLYICNFFISFKLLFIILLVFISIFNLFINLNNNLNNNTNINYSFLYCLYIKYNLFALYSYIDYIYEWYKNLLIYFFTTKISFLKYFTLPVFWYPIFKRSSIFGFYRISRQRWTELKTEEVNYLKY